MKGSLTTTESVDPYAALENILKTIKRLWLSEEWRLEDIRLLAQEAIERREAAVPVAAKSAMRPHRPQRRRSRVMSPKLTAVDGAMLTKPSDRPDRVSGRS
jgi:hypothetical protein